jgi:hypothetical protein
MLSVNQHRGDAHAELYDQPLEPFGGTLSAAPLCEFVDRPDALQMALKIAQDEYYGWLG